MSLEIVLGPMKSGKSSYLMEQASRLRAINSQYMIINHSSDKRYGDAVVANHNHASCPCIAVTHLMSQIDTPEFAAAQWVFVDESQFFDDLVEFITVALDRARKNIIIIGLSGDYRRQPFGQTAACIPLADKVTLLHAMCERCADGTPGIFTQRKSGEEEQVVIGGSEIYEVVCRRHYKGAH